MTLLLGWNRAHKRPSWVRKGASLDLDFINDRGFATGLGQTTALGMLETTRNTPKTYTNSVGGLALTAVNEAIRDYGYAASVRPNILKWSQTYTDAIWNKNSGVITANTTVAPDGTTTASTFASTSGQALYQNITVPSGATYTTSVYLKAGTATNVLFRDDTGPAGGRHIQFNPATGAITSVAGALIAYGVTPVGNGWYRYWMTYVTDATTMRAQVRSETAGTFTFYVWGYQVELGATLTPYYATTAVVPRVDYAPLACKGMPLWEQRTNMTLYSRDFWYWLAVRANPIQNMATAPDGTYTAYKLVTQTTTTGQEHYLEQNVAVVSGLTYSMSWYLKAGEFQRAMLRTAVAAVDQTTTFDLAYGVVTLATHPSNSMEYVGNGWYRCSVTFVATSTGNIVARVQLVDAAGTASHVGDGLSGFYIWGAQVELGAFPTPYIASAVTWTSRYGIAMYMNASGWLQKSINNLLTHSDQMGNAASWATWHSTISSNVIADPNGAMTADRITEDATANVHSVEIPLSATSGITYTYSVHVKAGERTSLTLRMKASAFGVDAGVDFNLTTLTTSNPAGTNTYGVIIPAGNGWYRCCITTTATATAMAGCYIAILNPAVNYIGDGTSGMYIWGAQLEVGCYATTYVPTTTVATGLSRYNYDPLNLSAPSALMVEQAAFNRITYSQDLEKSPWVTTNGVVFPNATTAPDGTLTADLIQQVGATTLYVGQPFSYVAGTSYTFSVYAKPGDYGSFYILLYGNHWATDTVTHVAPQFNVTTGVATKSINPTEILGLGMQLLPNGWYRCWATVTAKVTGSSVQQLLRFTDPNAPKNMYFWGYQVENGVVPTSYIPSTDNWTARAGTALYTNSAGYLATQVAGLPRLSYNPSYLTIPPALLTESAATNLLTRTNEFAHAEWIQSDATATGVLPNVTTAPDGTLTACKLVEETTASVAHGLYNDFGFSSEATLTMSLYVKASERSFVRLSIWDGMGVNAYADFNLNTGVVGTSGQTGSGITLYTYRLQSVGNAWYRVSITATTTGITYGYARVQLLSADATPTYAGTLGSGLFLWGAQLEAGSAPSSFIPSTDTWTSRLSPGMYTNSAGYLALAAYNLLSRSQEFDNASWIKATSSTITANATTAPDGTVTADKMVETTAVSSFHYVNQGVSKATSATQYTFSAYLKAGGREVEFSMVSDGGSNGAVLRFNPSTGLITAAAGVFGTFTGPFGGVISIGSGWYRVYLTATTGAAASVLPQVALHTGTSNVYTGDGTSGVYLWGTQLELGSYANSYVPTTTIANSTARLSYNPFYLTAPPALLNEAAATNLFSFTKNPENSYWGKARATIQPGSTTAPDGTLTAVRLVEDTQSGPHHFNKPLAFTSGSTYTLSCFVKSAQRTKGVAQLGNGVVSFNGGYATVSFDLVAKTATKGTYGIAAGIQEIFNGWFRVWITGTADSSGTDAAFPVFLSNGSSTNYAGDGASGMHVWGSQLEVGSYPTSYVQSSDSWTGRAGTATYVGSSGVLAVAASGVARYSYNQFYPTAPPALVIEESRTNLFMNTGTMSGATAGTPTATGIDGNPARVVVPNAGVVNYPSIGTNTLTLSLVNTATFDYAMSGYVHAPVVGAIMVEPYFVVTVYGNGSTAIFATVHVNTTASVFTIRSSAVSAGLSWVAAPMLTLMPNGSYRLDAVVRYTQDASLRNSLNFAIQARATNASGTFTADGVSGFQVSCVQGEVGSYPTSYIPTTTSQVTRVADSSTSASATRAADTTTSAATTRVADTTTSVATTRATDVASSAQTTRSGDVEALTGTNFSRWYRQDAGIWVIESTRGYTGNYTSYPTTLCVSDGTSNNRILLYAAYASQVITAGLSSAGVEQLTWASTPTLDSSVSKASLNVKTNDVRWSVNGVSILADTSATVPQTMNQVHFGSVQLGTNNLNGYMRRATFYPFENSNLSPSMSI